MVKSIFVTATGTDVGKTFVSALIVKKMRDLGFDCKYYKPALSGAEIINGKLVPGDCAYVLKTAGIQEEPSECASYIFEQAVSPHLAAEINDVSINLDKIKSDFANYRSEYVVVEGAGGITCPFNLKEEKILLPDVIKALGLDAVVIADAQLGTINYTVLTIEYAKQHGINVKGIILNKYDENNFMQVDNKKRIEDLTGVRVIAVVKEGETNLDINKDTLINLFKEI